MIKRISEENVVSYERVNIMTNDVFLCGFCILRDFNVTCVILRYRVTFKIEIDSTIYDTTWFT